MLVANLPHITQWALSCTNTDGIQICMALRSRHEKTCLLLAETGSNLHLGAKSLSQGDLLCRSKMLFLCRTQTHTHTHAAFTSKSSTYLVALVWGYSLHSLKNSCFFLFPSLSVFFCYLFSLVLFSLIQNNLLLTVKLAFYKLNFTGIMPVWV